MNNEQIEGMVPTADGRYAVMVDTKNGHYGWVFVKHPDGMWVSSRRASPAELSAAEHHYNSVAAMRRVFGGLTGKDKVATPKCETCGDAGYLEVPRTPGIDCPVCTPAPDDAKDDVLADHNRLVRELDVLLNGEAGAAKQASLCDIVAQVRWARKNPGTGPLQLLALVPDQVVGRVYDTPQPATVELNSLGRALPDGAPLYSRPADTLLRYVRAPSRKDPKYHEEWPEIDGGLVFDGETYCNDLFAALKRYNVIVAETMPEGAVDE